MYPRENISRIVHKLSAKHSERELYEVVGELEWLRNVRSILPRPKPDDVQKQFELTQAVL